MGKSTQDAPKKSGAAAKSPRQRRSQPDHIRLNRDLRMISDCNQTLVRAHDESTLVPDVCRVIVETGGYLMAWVGYAENDKEKSVRAVARAGRDEGYVDSLRITWADTERGRGPTGSAIRTGTPSTSRDMQTDPNFGPWRAEAVKRGFRSSIVLPLKTNGHVFGALSIYSGEADAFDEDEKRLLVELADDLAYGIMALREREARARSDQLLRRANEALTAERQRFADVLNAIPAYVVLLSPDYHVPFANRFFEERFGKSNGKRCFEYLFGRTEPCEICDTFEVFKDGQPHRWEWVGPDGRDYSIFDFPFMDTDGANLILEMGIDVTERKQAEEAVRTLNAELEKRVEERTSALLATNEKLQGEIAERQQAEEALRQSEETLASLALFPSENPNPVMRIGRDGRLLYGNPASKGFLAALGASGDQRVSPVLHRAALSALSAEAVTEFEFTDDQDRTYWLSCAPVPERDYANIYVRNITERVQAEAALRESEQRYRSLFETMSEGFCLNEIICDEQGNPCDLRFLVTNPGFEQQTGLRSRDIVDHTLLELFPAAEPAWIERFGRVALTGESAQFEERFGPLERWFDIRAFQIEPGRFAVMFMDVTERRRAEETLRETAERLELALTASRAGTWDWDLRTQHLVWSSQLFRMFGLDPASSESTLEVWDSVMFPQDRAQAHARLETAIREHRILDNEYRVVWPNGDVRWINALGKAVYDDQGQPVSMSGLCIDFTERKILEQKLEESERLYRGIGETLDYGIWVCDPNGRNIYASESYLKLVGITQQQCSDFGWGDTLHPDDAERTIAAWKECTRTGGTWDIEHRFRGVDGKWHPILARGVPIRNEHGDITAWAGINLDISRMKQTEEALRISSRRLEILANTAGELLRAEHPQAMIETLCKDVMQHLDCQVFFNFLADPQVGRLHLNAYAGVSDEEAQALEWLDYGQAICGRVAQRGRRIIAQHIPTTYEPGAETVSNLGVKAYCCHPLLGAEGQVLGTLSFGTRTRETFTEDEVAMMKAVCDSVAVAMARIKAQETITESEERFRALFSEMQSGAAVHEIILDAQGKPVDYRFLDINPAFELQTGLKREAVVGKKLSEILPDSEPFWVETYGKVALTGEPVRFENIHETLGKHYDCIAYRPRPRQFAVIFNDVTDRKRAEAALRETKDLLENLINHANAPIIVWNPQHEITLFNHAFERLTGRTADEVIGAKLDFLFPELTREHSLDHIRRALAGEKWEVEEIPIVHRDGSVRTVLWNSATIFGEDGGAPVATIAQGQDITIRMRAQEALRESEQRWATTLSSIGDAVIATDELGQVTFMNSVAEGLTGWTLAEAATRPVEDVLKLIDGASRAPMETPVTAALRQGMIVGLTNHTILIRKDGSEVMIDDSGAPIRDADGLVTGVVVVFRDITERKRAEEAILRAKQEWERTFDSVPDLIAILDDSHRMLRANRAMAQSLSLTPGQCIGKFCYQAVHAMSCPHESCPHTLTIRDGRMHTAEVHEPRLGGDFLITTTPLTDENGKRIGSVHVARDITERKQLEETIRRHNEELAELVQERTQQIAVLERQRMEGEKQASLGRMAARIAHEINNPLAAIKNAFRIVRKSIPPESPDLNFLSLIDSEMTRIERIVRQTFELYKPNPSESASVAPMSVVEDVVQLMRGGLQAREVNIVLEEPKEPFKVSVHPDSLKQLLYGILQNAVEASSPKTTVRVSITREGSSFTLAIADQGCGIPEDIRQKLFDPFFTTKAGLETGGLGLGLSIAHSLLDAMGGTISFESTVGKGTTFFITLPLTAPEVPAGRNS